MENKMFCFQCQETAQCTGCTRVGVCRNRRPGRCSPRRERRCHTHYSCSGNGVRETLLHSQ